jgi:cyclophilin family peptidyl-prolyl cis-trans isomerase
MARTGNPNSATAQFFINVVNNDMLNAPKPDGHGYAVFGKVVKAWSGGQNPRGGYGQPWHAPECAHHAGHHHLGHRAALTRTGIPLTPFRFKKGHAMSNPKSNCTSPSTWLTPPPRA